MQGENNDVLAALPTELQLGIKAVDTPDVQQMIKALAKYNLGVYLPHIHPETGGFNVLPMDMVAVETDNVVSFVKRSEVAQISNAIPVAWSWDEEKSVVSARCTCHHR